eukprot:11472250-Heterocapsa_arctica.AAC.1
MEMERARHAQILVTARQNHQERYNIFTPPVEEEEVMAWSGAASSGNMQIQVATLTSRTLMLNVSPRDT